jgi:hypothetical protein
VAVRALIALGVGAVVVYLPYRDPLGLVRAHLAEPDRTSVASRAVPLAVAALVVLAALGVAWAWRRSPATAVERAGGRGGRLGPAAGGPSPPPSPAPGCPGTCSPPLAVVALARSLPLLVVLGALAGTSFVMGWWESIDTRAHALPEVQGSRSGLYLLVAVAAVAVAGDPAQVGGARLPRAQGSAPGGARDDRWVELRRRGRSGRRTALLAAALLVVVVGCSSSPDGDDAAPPSGGAPGDGGSDDHELSPPALGGPLEGLTALDRAPRRRGGGPAGGGRPTRPARWEPSARDPLLITDTEDDFVGDAQRAWTLALAHRVLRRDGDAEAAAAIVEDWGHDHRDPGGRLPPTRVAARRR